jgi:hypothetical protein
MDATVTGNVSKNSTSRVSAAPFAEASPMPMAAVNAASHILCYVNSRLLARSSVTQRNILIGNSLASVVAALNAYRGDSAWVVVGLTLQSRWLYCRQAIAGEAATSSVNSASFWS